MKLVSIIIRDGVAYIESNGRTPDWLWIGLGNVKSISMDSEREEIGQAILDALSESALDVSVPPTPDALGAKARFAGFKTFESFAKGAKSILVEENESGIEFIPSSWEGGKKGFVPREKESFFPEINTTEGIGFALVQANVICQ